MGIIFGVVNRWKLSLAENVLVNTTGKVGKFCDAEVSGVRADSSG
jgi:hypothetical protein